MKKLYLLLMACCFGLAANALTFQPSTQASFTGGATTYCRGDVIAPLNFVYNICPDGTGAPVGASCTVNWYYNPTNTTAITGATTLAFGPLTFSTPFAATGSLSFTPVLPVGGDYYYFCVITWTGGTAACGGVTGTLTSTTQHIRVTPPPIISSTGSMNVCVGSSFTLSNAFTGGTWTSTNAGVVSVTPAGPGLATATGVSGGAVNITYTLGGCYATAFVIANDTPTAIAGITSLTPGGPLAACATNTYTLTSTPAGGTWLSDNVTIANVDATTGVLTTGPVGTARITYTNGTTGCVSRRMVTVNANPAPITGTAAICQSTSTVLGNASAPAGTWISSNPTGMPVSPGGTVTGTATGTATISYKLIAAPGCQSTVVVTVNNTPAAITGPSAVCAGSNITLANTVTGGVWTSGDISKATVSPTTGVVSGVANGTVNISYTTGGCVPAVKTLTINPLPGSILGILSTCYGSTTTLSSTASGGTWISDNPTVATINSVTGTVTGHTMGMSIITYLVGSGCFTTATITVNPVAPIVGSDTVCVGATIALTNIVGGGTWVSGNPAIAEIDTFTGIVEGLVNGISYIGYLLPSGCASTFLLNVIPALPPIAGPLSVCSGATVVLSNGVTGGRWVTTNMYVAELDSVTGSMTGRFPDTASITYKQFGCVTTSQVTVMPLPNPSISFNWSTGKVSTLPVYASYQWYDSTLGVIPGATQSYYVVPSVQKTYYVRVTDFNGCSNNSDYMRIPLGVQNVDLAARCNIYPNPATAVVNIDAPVDVKAIISSVEGKVVYQAEKAKQVDVSGLPPGLYLIGLYDDSGQLITMRKLTKE